MLNEFLIFTAIILLPINAILIDHVSVRREVRKRLKKNKKRTSFKIDTHKVGEAFRQLSTAATKTGLAFQSFGRSFRQARNFPEILIHRGNSDKQSGCFILPTPGIAKSFFERAFLKEEKRLFGVNEDQPVLWDSCSNDILGDINRACEDLKNEPVFMTDERERQEQYLINFGNDEIAIPILAKRTDRARRELNDFRASLIKGVDDKGVALGIFEFAKFNNIDTRNITVTKQDSGYVVDINQPQLRHYEIELTFDTESGES